MTRTRNALGAVRVGLATLLLVLCFPADADAAPPGIPDTATARTYLSELTVKTEGSMTGYSRDKFPHWITIEGTCDTRETVLKRDGTNVSTGSDCYPTSGSWYSEYDGVTTSDPSSFDIDHIVQLAEAWRSGASSWTTAQRQAFANDLDHSQLIAVSASSNRSKSDQDPSTWVPTRTAYGCTYAKMWIASKHQWDLAAQQAEVDELTTLLDTCA
ncbi:HNH endonuclease family protein [Luteipulveratus sp. YIM 133132]|uniref:HNH endonuclease family protein n=1 Tax=Luteipulveratus flavus TaxID=3031728 RepID=UPI0023AF0C66|nr:HNH endonuclease family protein [Luteipulveratus sp. YIM 133132]MDE9366617.1 HNH endonuclease family protein [Luteipulveratus sp. YIM 133132]